MSSRLITPPDRSTSENSILIINALDRELATLVLWLKTVESSYDIHLYHSQMPLDSWINDTVALVKTILVSGPELAALDPVVKDLLDCNKDRIIYFGHNTQYPDLIQYFLTKKVVQE